MTESTSRRDEIEKTLRAAARRLDALALRLTVAGGAVRGASQLLADAVVTAGRGTDEVALRDLKAAAERALRLLLAHSSGGPAADAVQIDEIAARLVGLVHRMWRDELRAGDGPRGGSAGGA